MFGSMVNRAEFSITIESPIAWNVLDITLEIFISSVHRILPAYINFLFYLRGS